MITLNPRLDRTKLYWIEYFKEKHMSVKASIHPLPVLVTDADVNKLEVEEAPDQAYKVIFEDNHEIGGCCGTRALGGATVNDDMHDNDALWPQHKEAFKQALRDNESPRAGLMVYTLVDNQVVEREGLLESGYQVTAVFKNPNTGNRVTLYCKLINQPRERPAPAKAAKKKAKARR